MHLRDGLQTHATVRQRYDHLVKGGSLQRDPAQERIADRLDLLIGEIAEKRVARKSSALGWLFAARRQTAEPVKGLYIHGGVGRGKTMLMDIFFELVPVRRKRRAHFNDFMADVHDRIQKHRQARKEGLVKEDDPIPPVARALADEAWVLCFDEFAVTDIADAMILSRLFSALFANGVVVVATSNVMPADLYRDGLNRQLFLPFIALFKEKLDVLHLAAQRDYRLQRLSREKVWFSPLGPASDAALDRAWNLLTDDARGEPGSLEVLGRKLAIPRQARGVARFAFADLCEAALGPADYLAIARHFHTVMIDGIPTLSPAKRNEAKRFVTLIDTLYEAKVKLLASAEAPPETLYPTGDGAFEFQRCVSRLNEMQSEDYRALEHSP